MKTYSPQRYRGREKRQPAWSRVDRACSVLLFFVPLCLCGSGLAASSTPDLPGRLFYTPAQRAQLEAARAHNGNSHARPDSPRQAAPPPLSYDGVVIRSDGTITRWVNGQPQAGASGVAGLKPGQIRADGKVYEPYQVLRPTPAPAIARNPAP